MKIGYYPGCSLTGTSNEYDVSLREVLTALNVELTEINDWSCCGASSAHATNHLLATALPARNLLLAHKQSIEEVMAPCAACYSRLVAAQHELSTDPFLKNKIEDLLEEPYLNGVEVLNIIQLFERIGASTISKMRKFELKNTKAACYYGCLLIRPHDLTHSDDDEEPASIEKIVNATGAKTIDWNHKIECCGGAHSIAHTEIVTTLSKKIIDDAINHGANVIVVACPMCHVNLDMRQINIRKQYPGHRPIPIVYLSQLIGLSLGMDQKRLGMNLHFISTDIPAFQSEETAA